MGSTEEEMTRWKERGTVNGHRAPGREVPSKTIPGSCSAFFSSYSSLALCSPPPDSHPAKERGLTTEEDTTCAAGGGLGPPQ